MSPVLGSSVTGLCTHDSGCRPEAGIVTIAGFLPLFLVATNASVKTPLG